MIVVDTSAILAVLLREPGAAVCMGVWEAEESVLVSAGTLAELFIIAATRGIADDTADLIDRIGADIVPVTETVARQVGDAYARWGKGIHPAGLNFGDCFAYVLAKDRNCPLLYVGNDFAMTDVKSAF